MKKTSIRDQILAKNDQEQKLTETGYRLVRIPSWRNWACNRSSASARWYLKYPNLWWQWCWRHRDVGDFMMVTDFRCWWQNHYVGDFINVLNRSPTSKTCHQRIWSPTSVTNIDITICSVLVIHVWNRLYMYRYPRVWELKHNPSYSNALTFTGCWVFRL